MSRTVLLRTLSAAALTAAYSATALATTPVVINGGGATSPQANYSEANDPSTGAPKSEFSLYNSAQTAVSFGTYWASGSGTGQQAFLQNDLTCNINKVTGANSGKCANTPGGANTVHYALSDNVLSSTQLSTWATGTYGQSAAGNLIQLPLLGTATTFPIKNAALKKNGAQSLSDSDLCGIFSGLITDFSQITDSATVVAGVVTPVNYAAGPIRVVYRTDSAATTFLLTSHLAAVCTTGATGNTAPGVTFRPTTVFATLFANDGKGNITAAPFATTWTGQQGNAGVANYLAGLSAGAVNNAIGYVPPDWTSLTKATGGGSTLSNGQPSPLVVAAVLQGSTPVLPTFGNIVKGLASASVGQNLTPPTNPTDGANPSKWVPTIQVTSAGYPIVGYGTIDLPQCFADTTIQKNFITYLTAHYTNASYRTIQKAHGLVPIANSSAAAFLTTIRLRILANGGTAPLWNTNIGNTTACAGKAGR